MWGRQITGLDCGGENHALSFAGRRFPQWAPVSVVICMPRANQDMFTMYPVSSHDERDTLCPYQPEFWGRRTGPDMRDCVSLPWHCARDARPVPAEDK